MCSIATLENPRAALEKQERGLTSSHSSVILSLCHYRAAQPRVHDGVLYTKSVALQTDGRSDDMHEESDSTLIARAKKDSEAFGLLYDRYVNRIYNYIYYRTGNHHDAW